MRIKATFHRTIAAAMLAWALNAPAALVSYEWSSGFNSGGVVPDDNANGWADTRTVTTSYSVIENVNVTLNISGGFNGDLYCYLVHNDEIVILLNRVGRTAGNVLGYADAGFSITLSDLAGVTTDIHAYGGNGGAQLTGTYQSDGRKVDPAGAVNTDARDGRLTSFNGVNPNGAWTLFFADMTGEGQSTVVSWGLQITAVPEPVTWALAIFGTLLAVGSCARCFRRRLGMRT